MLHQEGSFTTGDGLSIYTQAWLPQQPARARILLFHGLGEHSGRYAHVAAALVEAGFAVHALDHRGHGRSDGDRVFVKRYSDLLGDLAQFRRIVVGADDSTPLVVLGHSMGGNLAMGHVLDHQDGVAALVLSGPALQVGDSLSEAQIKIFSLVAKVLPKLRPQGLDASAISRDPAVVAAYRSDPLVFSGKITAGLGAALIGAMRSFPARYPTLRLPILIQHGTADQLADVAGSRALEGAAVNATITAKYYDGLAHEVYNEPERELVIADLIEWLQATV